MFSIVVMGQGKSKLQLACVIHKLFEIARVRLVLPVSVFSFILF